MEIKKTLSALSYRIEAKPEGGFIARPHSLESGGPTPELAPIEGATREEVQQKIEEKLAEMIASQIPTTFKLGGINLTMNGKVNVTTKTASGVRTVSFTGNPQGNSAAGLQPPPAIVPSNGSTAFLKVLVFAGVLALIYFFLLHRR